ncbi:coiled-coil domain-containing protein 142 [Gastrophryne carolinensis]
MSIDLLFFSAGSGSFLRPPVLTQGAELRRDVIDGALLQLAGEAPPSHVHAPVRPGLRQQLLLLSRQRHLLAISRHFILCQMTLQSLTGSAWAGLRDTVTPAELAALCARLREVTGHRASLIQKLRGHPGLSIMPRLLLVASTKAVLATEELVLAVLRGAARAPSEVTPDLCLSLALYNQVVAELAPPTDMAELHPISAGRALEVVAEERGAALAGRFCQGLSLALRSHAHMSCDSLASLIEEDAGQVTPALRALAGLHGNTWKGPASGSDSALYERYSALLWPVICSHVFHAFYPGGRGHQAPPTLAPHPEEPCVAAINFLQEALTAENLLKPGAALGLRLCERLLYMQSAIAWDRAVCRSLSSALTDKCTTSPLDSDDSAPRTHSSRTAGILATMFPPLSRSLSHVTPGSASRQTGLLSRCALSLQLCGAWLRGRAHLYVTSGSLAPLVLITHGDLPDVLLSLPHTLGSACTRRAQEVFQLAMPGARHWRSNTATGVEPVVSEYAEAGLGVVLRPVLEGARALCEEERVAAVSAALTSYMEAWMGHILRERLTFSLQGALQLRRDFDVVRDFLRSRDAGLSREEVQALLSLPVLAQADGAIACLLQQPSRKTYLQSGGCGLFLCCPPVWRVAVESVSDSLQSLESLERRSLGRGISGRLPQHSHASYLPQHQRQWLALRRHKRWSGLAPPWEGRETSDG